MYSVVLAAGGTGLRTGLQERKIWFNLKGKAIIEHTVEAFEADSDCVQIVIAAHQGDVDRLRAQFKDRVTVVTGGPTRADSVKAGLEVTVAPVVFIHDAARPCVTQTIIERLKEAMKHHQAVSLAIPVVDTIKTTQGDKLAETVPRDTLVAVQTPQAFQRENILAAYSHWIQAGKPNYPCDASLYEAMRAEPVYHVLGARTNIKFTTLDDVPLLEAVLS